MRIKNTARRALVILGVVGLLAAGCQTERQFASNTFGDTFSALLVPDTELNLYLYAKQDRPTTVPAELMSLDYDLNVESMSIWGGADDKEEAIAVGVMLVTAGEAQKVFDEISESDATWKLLRGKKLYLVQGKGYAASALQKAIESDRFVYYNDEKVFEVITVLPNGERTRLVTVCVLKNDPILLDFLVQGDDDIDVERIGKFLDAAKVNLVVGGLYTPNRINIAKASELIRSGNIAALDAGMLLVVKSDLPGFMIEPLVSNYLTHYGFEQYAVGDVSLYKGHGMGIGGDELETFVRIEGNFLFASMAGQEAYAETLIMSVYR